MSFYDRFVALCKLKGVTKSKALEEMGFAKSLAIKWKNNPAASPHANTISVIADYFGVPIDELMGRAELPTDELLIALSSRPDVRELAERALGSTPEEVMRLQRVWEAMEQ